MINNSTLFERFLQNRQKRINDLLGKYFTAIADNSPKKLIDAMKYVVLGGGKRLRPLLVYAIGKTYQADIRTLDAPACAIEIIHSFSLVHDDLPAMDNDSLRRGKPTCHLAFDEATAVLVGDVLAITAFQILSEAKNLSAERKILMIKILAEATGAKGMAGGQYADLYQLDRPNRSKLERIYSLKTGALISAAVKMGAIASGVDTKELALLEQAALNISLAFQIKDDILNIESNVIKLGKNVGTDKIKNKITYPVLVGVPEAKIKIEQLWYKTRKILGQLKADDNILQEFTSYIMNRDC